MFNLDPGIPRVAFPSAGLMNEPALGPLFSSLGVAGFDAIFQFRSGFLNRQLQTNLSGANLATLRATLPFEPGILPQFSVFAGRPLYFEVVVRRPRLITLLADPPPADGTINLDDAPSEIASDLGGSATVETRTALTTYAHVEWDVDINLILERFQVEVAAAETPSDTPPPSAPVGLVGASSVLRNARAVAASTSTPPPRTETLLLASGTVLTAARPFLRSRPRQYKAWVELEFHEGVLEFQEYRGDLQDLLDGGLLSLVNDAFDPLFGGVPVRITPRMALAGTLRAGENLGGLGDFRATFGVQVLRPRQVSVFDRVELAGLAAEVASGRSGLATDPRDDLVAPDFEVLGDFGTPPTKKEALSIGVNVSDDADAGSIDEVQPFFDDNNFAYYVSEAIIRSVIVLKWQRLQFPNAFEVEAPLELADPEGVEEPFSGRAQVRFSLLGSIPEVSLVFTEPDLQDALRLVCDHEIQILRLWQDGDEITDDVRDDADQRKLLDPASLPLVWNIQLFDPDTDPQTPVKSFLSTVAQKLLGPIYRPTIEQIGMQNIDGVTSKTAGVAIVRGNLV